jgi:hypothetical protein
MGTAFAQAAAAPANPLQETSAPATTGSAAPPPAQAPQGTTKPPAPPPQHQAKAPSELDAAARWLREKDMYLELAAGLNPVCVESDWNEDFDNVAPILLLSAGPVLGDHVTAGAEFSWAPLGTASSETKATGTVHVFSAALTARWFPLSADLGGVPLLFGVGGSVGASTLSSGWVDGEKEYHAARLHPQFGGSLWLLWNVASPTSSADQDLFRSKEIENAATEYRLDCANNADDSQCKLQAARLNALLQDGVPACARPEFADAAKPTDAETRAALLYADCLRRRNRSLTSNVAIGLRGGAAYVLGGEPYEWSFPFGFTVIF